MKYRDCLSFLGLGLPQVSFSDVAGTSYQPGNDRLSI
jgi:hypothetical protein